MLTDKIKVIPRELLKDGRGWFLKIITGKEEKLPQHTGEIYFTSGTNNQVKGQHYHIVAQEWFTLISGKAELKLEDINSKEQISIMLDSSEPVTVYIPPYVAHAIYNRSELPFILCAYTDVLYTPSDTIPYKI